MSKDKATNKYTQREWDRTVGWGSVPDEYKHESEKEQDNGKKDWYWYINCWSIEDTKKD